MLVAAIDVGSNTIRMLIGEVQDNILSRIHSDRAITRLAKGIEETGNLGEENMNKSISVLKDFSRSIKSYGATCVTAVGTSALREAKNNRSFIDSVFHETGIRIEIISGVKEAEFTAKGILLGARENIESSLIIDIGGGSTEWIIQGVSPHESLFSGSLPIGAVKLFERFMKEEDPPSPFEISLINREIDSQLLPLRNEVLEHSLSIPRLIGTGGTITTLASIDLGLKEYNHDRVHMHIIPVKRLYQLRDSLLPLPLRNRKEINGLEPGRADLIIPGILLTIRFVELFGFSEIIVSDYGLLEGLLKSMTCKGDKQ